VEDEHGMMKVVIDFYKDLFKKEDRGGYKRKFLE
jgi:hypothetical protein